MSKRKLDDAATEKIYGLIRAGNTLEVSAAATGIHRATLHRWMKQGKEQERGLYRSFLDEVEKAKAEAEARDVALIAKAATADWRAAAWRLERRSPRRYGQKVQLSVQAEFDSAMDKLERGLSPEEYEKVLALMAAEDEDVPELSADSDGGL
jgi:predicted site-specific integrase-resolvase